jgi:translation initiation factor 1 (eIF-1/SUI1)
MEHEKARQIIEDIEEEQFALQEIAKQLQKDINSG